MLLWGNGQSLAVIQDSIDFQLLEPALRDFPLEKELWRLAVCWPGRAEQSTVSTAWAELLGQARLGAVYPSG